MRITRIVNNNPAPTWIRKSSALRHACLPWISPGPQLKPTHLQFLPAIGQHYGESASVSTSSPREDDGIVGRNDNVHRRRKSDMDLSSPVADW